MDTKKLSLRLTRLLSLRQPSLITEILLLFEKEIIRFQKRFVVCLDNLQQMIVLQNYQEALVTIANYKQTFDRTVSRLVTETNQDHQSKLHQQVICSLKSPQHKINIGRLVEQMHAVKILQMPMKNELLMMRSTQLPCQLPIKTRIMSIETKSPQQRTVRKNSHGNLEGKSKTTGVGSHTKRGKSFKNIK